jgi:hypothetical protein
MWCFSQLSVFFKVAFTNFELNVVIFPSISLFDVAFTNFKLNVVIFFAISLFDVAFANFKLNVACFPAISLFDIVFTNFKLNVVKFSAISLFDVAFTNFKLSEVMQIYLSCTACGAFFRQYTVLLNNHIANFCYVTIIHISTTTLFKKGTDNWSDYFDQSLCVKSSTPHLSLLMSMLLLSVSTSLLLILLLLPSILRRLSMLAMSPWVLKLSPLLLLLARLRISILLSPDV